MSNNTKQKDLSTRIVSEYDGIRKFNDYVATIVLAIIIIAAITLVFKHTYSTNNHSEMAGVNVTISVKTDSTGILTTETKSVTDSIRKMFEVHEHLLNDKYVHILEQKENVQDFITWGSLLVTLILSIFGFFGYKSLHSIEERIEKTVEPIISEKALEKADNAASQKSKDYAEIQEKRVEDFIKDKTKYIDDKTKDIEMSLEIKLSNNLSKQTAEKEKAIKENLGIIIEDKIRTKVSDKLDDVAESSKTIGELQENLSKLNEKYEDLEYRIRVMNARHGQPQKSAEKLSQGMLTY